MEMKHYYLVTIPCFEIHRRQAERFRMHARYPGSKHEVDLLEGNGLTGKIGRDVNSEREREDRCIRMGRKR